MEKCKIITLSNQKGGVGKTTTTYTLALAKISEMNEDHIEWLSDMNFFSEMFILQTALTLRKIKLCDDLKNKFIKELKEELEVYSTDEFLNCVEE